MTFIKNLTGGVILGLSCDTDLVNGLTTFLSLRIAIDSLG
ncbi:hypothetical protein RMAECT_0703 [Rickettsia rhipicephali str. Ect]|uniref:Uncharacterized protein n=1 Tax=Rickettsia rhipicephali str. Ect TaxID=1359199 RepID=A0A0F3PES3_RICRH|nr:hypothetical protein RMAECT_0703 [Rickettsia rhipicephali str. Ect]